MIIDGHAHACGEYLNLKNIIEVLDRNKAEKIVLCPGEPGSKKSYTLPLWAEKYPHRDVMFFVNRIIGLVIKLTGASKHIDTQNRYVFELAQKSPDRILQAYWVNPKDKDCLKKLEVDYREFDFKMIKVHQCWHDFSLEGSNMEAILNWAAKKKLPIFIHISTMAQVGSFIKLANRHPDTTIIVAHLIGFESMINNIRNPNVYFDISPPQLISTERLQNAIAQAGADKILLGSDTPYGKNNLQINIQRINNLPISEEKKALIKGENMHRLLFPNAQASVR